MHVRARNVHPCVEGKPPSSLRPKRANSPGNAVHLGFGAGLPPDSLDADPTELPRAFRGYHRAATEELFRRVAWEYGVLAGEHRKLKREIEEGQLVPRGPIGDTDEDAHALFAVARKAVRDMRESARAECEKALKKARRRASEIEVAADHAATNAVAVIDAASELRANLQAALRRLESGQPVHVAPAKSLRDELSDPVPAPGGFETAGYPSRGLDPEGGDPPPEGPPNAA